MRAMLILGLLLMLCLVSSAQADNLPSETGPDKVVLQLKWKHQFQFAGYYAAIEKGYYREAGLEVEVVERDSTLSPVDLVLSGVAQYGVEGVNLLKQRLAGTPVVVLSAIFQHSPSVLISLGEKGIRTPTDLIGKKVMLNPYNDEEVLGMLLQEGIEINQIDFIPNTFQTESLTSAGTDLLNVYLTNEPYALEKQQIPHNILNPLHYGIDFYGDLLFTTEQEVAEHPTRVEAFRKASLQGWLYALEHPEEIIDLILFKYAPHKDRAHLQHEARETIKLVKSETVPVGHLNPGRFDFMLALLVKLGRANPDASLQGFIYNPEAMADLSLAELNWLAKNNKVRVMAGHAPPLMYAVDGRFEGILVDYLNLLRDTYGVQLEYLQMPWAEAISGIEDKTGPDLFPALRLDAGRQQKMVFSQPYISLPLVIFSRDDSDYIGGIEDLAGRKVPVPKGFLIQALLEKDNPKIETIEVADPEQALELLSTGEADAYIGSLMLGSHIAKEMGLENIKVAAPAPLLPAEHAFTVRKDWPELASLFNRILRRMTPQDHAEIRQRWLSMRYEHGISRRDLYRWAAGGGAVMLLGSVLFLLWNRSLSREVNRRRTTEQALIDSVLQYQRLVQTVPHGIVELDPSGGIVFCNEPCARMLDYRPQELSGVQLSSLVSGPSDLKSLQQAFKQTQLKAAACSLTLELIAKDGTGVDVQIDFNQREEDQEDFNRIIIVTDLTAHRRAEQALLDSENIYSSTFANVQAGVAHLSLDGRFVKANRFICQLLGYSEEHLRRLTFRELTHPEDRPKSSAMVQQLLKGQQETYSIEKRYLKKDGTATWGVVSVSLLKRPLQEDRFVVVVQDIEQIKRRQLQIELQAQNLEALIEQRTAELSNRVSEVEGLNSAMLNLTEDLQEMNQQLAKKTAEIEEVNKELEAFAYSISHDLRAPLRHVQSFAAILMQDAAQELSEASLRHLSAVSGSANKMGQLIDDLLEFSRAGRSELQLRTIDSKLLVAEAIAGMRDAIGVRRIDWRIGDLPEVQGDVGTLRQVFVNLIDNAVKYTSPRQQARIEIDCRHEAGRFVFNVSDNGVGFDARFRDKLFGVFSRLHRDDQFEGTGIGLANVKRIIKRHGGQVWAESELDCGAKFSFSLPVLPAEANIE